MSIQLPEIVQRISFDFANGNRAISSSTSLLSNLQVNMTNVGRGASTVSTSFGQAGAQVGKFSADVGRSSAAVAIAVKHLDEFAVEAARMGTESDRASSSINRMSEETTRSSAEATRTATEIGRTSVEIERMSTSAEQSIGSISGATAELSRFGEEAQIAAQGATGFGTSMGGMGTLIGGAAIGVGAAKGVSSLVGLASSAHNTNAMLETTELQFTTLLHSADKAKTKVQDLFEFAKKTPFEAQPIIEASRKLQVFGGDALNTMDNLTILGDASAAVGADIGRLAFWFGRAYGAVKQGRPITEGLGAFQEMGAIVAEDVTAIKELQASGATGDVIWSAFTTALQKNKGAMILQANSWKGLASTMADVKNLAMADMFSPLFEGAKKVLASFVSIFDTSGFALFQDKIKFIVAALAGPVIERIVDFFKRLAGSAEEVAAHTTPLDKFGDMIVKITLGLKKFLPVMGLAAGAFVGIGAKAMASVPLIGKFMGPLGRLNPLLAGAIGLMMTTPAGRAGLMSMMEAIKPMIPKLMEAFQKLMTAILPILPIMTDLVVAVLPAMLDVVVFLIERLTQFAGWIGESEGRVKLLVGTLGALFLLKKTMDVATAIGGIYTKASDAAGKVGSLFGKLKNTTEQVAGVEKINTSLSKTEETAKKAAAAMAKLPKDTGTTIAKDGGGGVASGVAKGAGAGIGAAIGGAIIGGLLAAATAAAAALTIPVWAVVAIGAAIITALVGAIMLVVKHKDTLIQWSKNIWKFLSESLPDALSKIPGILNRFFTETLPKALVGMAAFALQLPGKIAVFIAQGLVDGVKGLIALPKIIGDFLSGLNWGDIGMTILKAIAFPFIGLPMYLIKMVPGLGDAIGKIIEAVVKFFEKLPGKIVHIVDKMIDTLFSWIKDPSKIFGDVTGFGKAIGRFITETLPEAIGGVVTWIKENAVKLFTDVIPAIGQALGSLLSGVWEFVKTNVAKGFEGFPDEIGVFFTKVVDKVKDAVGSVVDLFKNLPGKILGFAETIGKAALDIGSKIMSNIVDGIKGAFTAAMNFADIFLDALKKGWNWVIAQANRVWNNLEVRTPFGTFGLPDNILNSLRFNLAEGGVVPGRRGEPVLGVAHGGEFILSEDVVRRIKQNRPTVGAGMASYQQASAPMAATGAAAGGETMNITVNAYGPDPIAVVQEAVRELPWQMKVARLAQTGSMRFT